MENNLSYKYTLDKYITILLYLIYNWRIWRMATTVIIDEDVKQQLKIKSAE